MKPTPPSAHSLTRATRHLSRIELGIVAALCLIGAGLRWAHPDRMAVEHFDEGVYASNIWFDADDGFRYPAQHLFAPPLLPALIELSLLLTGPSNLGSMLPSLFAGCLTIPLVWWIGREWFGPVAGVAAATAAALSDVHALLSRTALTDVLLAFWLLLAVYFLWRALAGGERWSIVAAGLLTSFAWWTKYNGWLPLAIGAGALLPWWFFSRWPPRKGEDRLARCFDDRSPFSEPEGTSRTSARQGAPPTGPMPGKSLDPWLPGAAAIWLAVAGVAVAAWLPWLWNLQSLGGYSSVAANHRGYVVGLSGWVDSCVTQVDNLNRLEGTEGRLSPLVAITATFILAIFGAGRFTWNGPPRPLPILLGIALIAGLLRAIPGWMLTAAIGAGGIAMGLFIAATSPPSPTRGRVSLGIWLLTSWFVGLSLTTPLYTPFPRLTLPWLVASWLSSGLAVQIAFALLSQRDSSPAPTGAGPIEQAANRTAASRTPLYALPATIVILALIGTGTVLFPSRKGAAVPAWKLRTAARDEGVRILEACRAHLRSTRMENEPFVIYTLGEPALLFQLRLAGGEIVRPIGSLALAHADAPAPQLPSFVLLGEQARRNAGFAEDFEAARGRLTLLYSGCLETSLVVRLDSRDAKTREQTAESGSPPCSNPISLYRIK